MAKTTGPLFSAEASGSIAGMLTFQPKMGGGSVRRMPTRKPDNTPAQVRNQQLITVPQSLIYVMLAADPDNSFNQISLGDNDAHCELILDLPDRLNTFTRDLLKKGSGTIELARQEIIKDGGLSDFAYQWFYAQTSGDQDYVLESLPIMPEPSNGTYGIAALAILITARRYGLFNPDLESYLFMQPM